MSFSSLGSNLLFTHREAIQPCNMRQVVTSEALVSKNIYWSQPIINYTVTHCMIYSIPSSNRGNTRTIRQLYIQPKLDPNLSVPHCRMTTVPSRVFVLLVTLEKTVVWISTIVSQILVRTEPRALTSWTTSCACACLASRELCVT